MEDKELTAMQSVLAALEPLESAEQVRVLRWAWERFGDETGTLALESRPLQEANGTPAQFPDVGKLIEAAGASNGPERALCVAYFIQEVSGRPGFSGQEVNSELRNLGHPLANVTKTLGDLRAQKPSLVMQVSKSGRARQARKTYRLTGAGIDRVHALLQRDRTEGGRR